MLLNEEFLEIWEELDALNEAKADTEKLINFAGEELANKFLALKTKLKAPENDLYYWIKNKTPEELASFLAEVEGTKSNTQLKKETSDQGAKLVCSSEHWNVYHITTFEASQKYGRDTKWCITGVNNWGDKYWKEYTENGIQFYFLITKGDYDPRGKYSKIAIAVCEYPFSCEVFNQQDTPMRLNNIPYLDEIKIPGVDLKEIYNQITCFECGENLDGKETYLGPHDEVYCKDCFELTYYRCAKCNEIKYVNISYLEDEHGNKYCSDCLSSRELITKTSGGLYYEIYSDKPYKNFEGIFQDKNKAIKKLEYIYDFFLAPAAANASLSIIRLDTGEIIFETAKLGEDNLTKVIRMLNSSEDLV